MSMFNRVAKVQAAQLRMRTARHALTTPVAALLVRGREHPLTTVGVAAGAGFALGSLDVHPLRVPGLGSLLGGGLAEVVALGARWVAESAIAPAAAADAERGEPA